MVVLLFILGTNDPDGGLKSGASDHMIETQIVLSVAKHIGPFVSKDIFHPLHFSLCSCCRKVMEQCENFKEEPMEINQGQEVANAQQA